VPEQDNSSTHIHMHVHTHRHTHTPLDLYDVAVEGPTDVLKVREDEGLGDVKATCYDVLGVL